MIGAAVRNKRITKQPSQTLIVTKVRPPKVTQVVPKFKTIKQTTSLVARAKGSFSGPSSDDSKNKSLLVVGCLCLGCGAVMLLAGAFISQSLPTVNTIGFIFVGMGLTVILLRFILPCICRTGKRARTRKISAAKDTLVLEDVHVEPVSSKSVKNRY